MKFGKPSRFLLFMTLFVLCGQAVAAPLLACRNMLASSTPATQAMEEHCAGMMMDVASADDLMDLEVMSPISSVNAVDNQQQNPLDCDLVCQYCRALSPADVSDPALEAALLLSRTGANSDRAFPVPAPSDHFRPPAAA